MPTNPCATGWTASIFSPTTIVVDGNTFPQTAQGIQAAVDSIKDASASKPYTILLYPGVYNMNWADTSLTLDLTGTTTPFSAGTGGKDYIGLAGLDRQTTILQRTTALGLLTAVIQGCPHTVISNLTIDSTVTRHVHWDTIGELWCNRVNFKSASGGTSAGISSGIKSDSVTQSIHRITDCHFITTQYACHSNVDPVGALENQIWITGNTFDSTGTIIGLDLSSAGANSSFAIYLSGNVQSYFNVDPGTGAVDLSMPTNATAAPKVKIYTDGSLRFASIAGDHTATNNYYHNAVIYPQDFTGYQVTGVAPVGVSGNVMVYDFSTGLLRSATATGQNFPTVCVNERDSTGTVGWWPHLATGPRAACFMATAGAVALGDTVVTFTSGNQGYVNNAATGNQILGWAETTKSAAASGLVVVRRNTAWDW